MPKVAIVAGDASGDLYGSKLIGELRQLISDCDVWAAGGPHLKNAGAQLAADLSQASAIGVVESLKVVPSLYLSFRKVLNQLKKKKPDVLVLIDFGAFNRRLGLKARKAGIRTVYFIPPGSWRKSNKGAVNIAECADLFLTPFPWSAKELSEAGANAVYTGHPLMDIAKPSVAPRQFRLEMGLAEDAEYVALLPGSRRTEIKYILPSMLGAAEIISDLQPGLHFIIAAAPAVSERVQKTANKWRKGWRERIPLKIVENRTCDVLAGAKAAVVASGTATLEAAIIETPLVVIYRGSRLMILERMLRPRILGKYIALPNILAEDSVCEELIGKEASSEAIAAEIVRLLRNHNLRSKKKCKLKEVKSMLGEPGALRRTAEQIASLLKPSANER